VRALLEQVRSLDDGYILAAWPGRMMQAIRPAVARESVCRIAIHLL
jgi:hypothetical protein